MNRRNMKNLKRFVILIGCVSFLSWGTVLTVLAWNDEVSNRASAAMTVEPQKAILAAGIAGIIGVLLFLVRNRKRYDIE